MRSGLAFQVRDCDYLFAVTGCAILLLTFRFVSDDKPGFFVQIVLAGIIGLAFGFVGASEARFIFLGAFCGYVVFDRLLPIALHASSHGKEVAEKLAGGAEQALDGIRKRRAWVTCLLIALLIGPAVLLIVTDQDNDPNAYVAEVIAFPLNIRAPIAKLCVSDNSVLELRALRVIATREPFPAAALRYDIKPTTTGSVLLQFEMREVLWEAASRYHSTAVPGGAKIVFEGRCAGANQFVWNIHDSTNVTKSLLPELRAGLFGNK